MKGRYEIKDDIVIVSGARTPVGAFNGAFGALPAHELGKVAITETLKRAGVEGAQVSEVILGQILTAGQGQNPARQASIGAGIPVESPAWGINQLCGSGLRAVALGYQAILNGDAEIVVAGGQESMSQAPHCAHLRNGVKMGSLEMVDTMIKDGAAAVVLMKASEAQKLGRTPLARIVSWAHAGVDPAIMGTGPIPASRAALKKAGWKVEDLDLVEANEAFAAQACAVNKDLGWDTSKINVNRGAIAISQPIVASSPRVLVSPLGE